MVDHTLLTPLFFKVVAYKYYDGHYKSMICCDVYSCANAYLDYNNRFSQDIVLYTNKFYLLRVGERQTKIAQKT